MSALKWILLLATCAIGFSAVDTACAWYVVLLLNYLWHEMIVIYVQDGRSESFLIMLNCMYYVLHLSNSPDGQDVTRRAQMYCARMHGAWSCIFNLFLNFYSLSSRVDLTAMFELRW